MFSPENFEKYEEKFNCDCCEDEETEICEDCNSLLEECVCGELVDDNIDAEG